MTEEKKDLCPVARICRYTDGTEVREGDRVRSHQAPGGMMSPATDINGNVIFKYGTAGVIDMTQEKFDRAVARGAAPGTLKLFGDDGFTYNLLGHVIERIEQ